MKSWKITALYLLLASGACTAWRASMVLMPSEARSTSPEEDEDPTRRQFMAALNERLQKKEHVVRRVLAGEIGLLEAAVLFDRINQEPPELDDRMRACIEGATEEEKLCRQVISWVNAIVTTSTDPRERALGLRLEAELETYLCTQGQPVLPRPD
jgi:hypothetical protein